MKCGSAGGIRSVKGKRHIRVSALTWVEVEITEHSEGGSVYRPRLCLGKAEFVPVSMFWYQTKEHSGAVVREIQGFLHLSPTS